MTRFLALLTACLMTSGCDDLVVTPYRYGEVEVLAVRTNGAPVEHVEFLLYTGTRHLAIQHTDAGGRTVFRYAPQGSLGVSAVPPRGHRILGGESGRYTEFTMTEGGRHTAAFELAGPGAMRVRVVDTHGEPAIGVWVEVYTPDGVVAGRYLEDDRPLQVPGLAGDHGVRAMATDRCPVGPRGVVYSDGHWIDEDVTVDVTLVVEPCA